MPTPTGQCNPYDFPLRLPCQTTLECVRLTVKNKHCIRLSYNPGRKPQNGRNSIANLHLSGLTTYNTTYNEILPISYK